MGATDGLSGAADGGVGERKITPMLRQFLDAKADAPRDAILFFRMGDFYETFFDDAKIAARELDLTLTSRDKSAGDPVPMAGVPHHAAQGYIARLVERGFSVAICDQLEDPKLAKGIVKRAITRVVTPGTVCELEALDPGAAAYLASVVLAGDDAVLALLDLLAGEVLMTRVPRSQLGDELSRMGARELVTVPDGAAAIAALVASSLPVREAEALPEKGSWQGIFGEMPSALAEEELAVCMAVRYAERTQRRPLKHIMPPRTYRIADYVVLDEATRRNLELTRTQRDAERRGSLLWHLDRCRTALGSRTLHQWLLFPLRERSAIERRQGAVAAFKSERAVREKAQAALEGVRDIERLVGRVAVGRATPKDLGLLRLSLARLPDVKNVVAKLASYLGAAWADADVVSDLQHLLARALVDDPPFATNEGGIFAKGFDADLDLLIDASTEGHGFLDELEKRERARTGITNLKVRYNRVFGYYIEITKANLAQAPADYVRKQTLVGAERFITPELKTYEDRVLGADERRRTREQLLFESLAAEVGGFTARLRAVSRLVAETDALASLAQVADECRYVQPELTEAPVLELTQSRHPVIERLLPNGERFIANDVKLDAATRQLLVVTGPNMAGKSTIMRQVGLTAVLAHVGSFVPAQRALIGLCDRVFTRVGASDNLGRGQSTFMVEMLETATILKQASARSLVLLDEIGRCTSTFDGVSIAWAVAEHVHDVLGCRAMFATHYHELTDLTRERPRIVNVSVAVKESQGTIVFLRRLVDGAANRSYGIQVAQLAGVPEPVLARAREILTNLESGELDSKGMPVLAYSRRERHDSGPQLALFAAPRPSPSAVEAELRDIDPMATTPMQALAHLERLRRLLDA
ncbi:MAG: DNA mismatch repair protein MutS [Myxococcota bacterium]